MRELADFRKDIAESVVRVLRTRLGVPVPGISSNLDNALQLQHQGALFARRINNQHSVIDHHVQPPPSSLAEIERPGRLAGLHRLKVRPHRARNQKGIDQSQGTGPDRGSGSRGWRRLPEKLEPPSVRGSVFVWEAGELSLDSGLADVDMESGGCGKRRIVAHAAGIVLEIAEPEPTTLHRFHGSQVYSTGRLGGCSEGEVLVKTRIALRSMVSKVMASDQLLVPQFVRR